MTNQPPPLPPPAGYDSWLDYAIEGMATRDLFNEHCAGGQPQWGKEDVQRGDMRAAARAELESLRKSHAELELKCALANAQLFNLKAALERIIEEDTVNGMELRDIAAEALKGLE